MLVKMYTLSDPTTGEIRYVGQTYKPLKKRLREHWCARRHGKQRVSRWVAKVGKPVIELLDEVPNHAADTTEEFWIAQFRAWGFNLTNIAPGGKTVRGHKLSVERVEQIRAKSREPKAREAAAEKAKAQHAIAWVEIEADIEARLRRGELVKAIPHSSSSVARVSKRMKAAGWTPPDRSAARKAGVDRHHAPARERIANLFIQGLGTKAIVQATGHSKRTVMNVRRSLEATGWITKKKSDRAVKLAEARLLVAAGVPHGEVMSKGYSNRVVMEARQQLRAEGVL